MRKVAAVTALILLTPLTAGCRPRGHDDGATGRPVHCDIVADSPRKIERADRIGAQVRFRCEPPGAQTLTLRLRLQRRDPSNPERWRTVAAKTFTLKGEQSHAPELDYNAREVSVSCKEGVYRTVVDWSRTSRGDENGDNLTTGVASNPCKRLFAD